MGRKWSFSSALFFLFISLQISLSLLVVVKSDDVSAAVPALYVFGDSLSDSGNNNYLPTKAKANYPPYGIDFVAGPTGRFTNGKTVVDFIAEKLGLPFVPPYLGLSREQRSKTLTGVNYASGSAGILPETGSRLGKCLPLREQLGFFQETLKSLRRNFHDKKSLSWYLSRSIFFIDIGSNDYINNYLQPDLYNSSKIYDPQEFADLLLNKLSENLQRLYKIGARKMVVPDLGAIGCIPAVTGTGPCVDNVNRLVKLFDARLGPVLDRLKSDSPGLIISRCGNLDQSIAFTANSTRLGFVEANIPCCDVSKNGGLCTPGQPPCTDRNKHMFYDDFHPTQAVTSIAAHSYFAPQPSSPCTPFNLNDLVHL